MNSYWNRLNQREQFLLTLGSVCLCFFLFYLCIYSPLQTTQSSLREQLKDKQETLLWMQSTRSQAKDLGTVTPITQPKLLAYIGKELNAGPLSSFTYQLQQASAGDIQLSFAEVAFTPFLKWLWDLDKTYLITFKQLQIGKTKTPGLVKLAIVITT